MARFGSVAFGIRRAMTLIVHNFQAEATMISKTTSHQLTFIVVPDLLAVCRLDQNGKIPAWASSGTLCSITRTADELSIVCQQNHVPDGIRCERGWRCLRVAGTMDFSMIGVVASLSMPLAEAGVGIFVISTFDTDYLLVKDDDFSKAVAALRAAGHAVAMESNIALTHQTHCRGTC
jgi:hypothetical protein